MVVGGMWFGRVVDSGSRLVRVGWWVGDWRVLGAWVWVGIGCYRCNCCCYCWGGRWLDCQIRLVRNRANRQTAAAVVARDTDWLAVGLHTDRRDAARYFFNEKRNYLGIN